MTKRRSLGPWILLLTLTLSLAGCEGCRKKARGKYFDSLEKIGLEKRDLLVKRVDKARDAQEDAQKEFEDALEELQSMVSYDGGELETMYDRLKGKYDDAESRAENVRDRIRKVENVAQALFEEWRQEIEVFNNEAYKRESRDKLQETKSRYGELLAKMKQASGSMEPVLERLRDQVLYLKHNLNAQTLGSLDHEADLLQADVSRLITDMQASIAEADRFIQDMKKES